VSGRAPLAGAAMCALATALLAVSLACTRPVEVATVRVERRDFAHRVRAEGTLVAERATSILVPPEVQPPARIAWLAADGIEVEAGQVIVRFDDIEMTRQLDQGRADFESSRLKADKAAAEGESQLLAIEGDRHVAELELGLAERFRKTDEEVFSRLEIVGSAIDGELAAERKDHAVELAGIHREIAATERDRSRSSRGGRRNASSRRARASERSMCGRRTRAS
jgi:multidrug efflux pump subunit AcrA (membrane-fusion protein)